MLSRRSILLVPLAFAASRIDADAETMTLALHQNTSAAAGYQRSLEGWSRAGIRQVELTSALLDDFLKTNPLAAARRVLTDNGLTPVSAAVGVTALIEPGPGSAALLDLFKGRCEQFATLGLTKVYTTSNGTTKLALGDYPRVAENLRAAGDVARQHGLTVMVEFVRASPYMSTLTTALKVIRAAAHPNVAPMFDCYHFWSGLNKLEDMDLLRAGEVQHVHFQDVPDMPRELLDNTTRLIPGDGVAPLTTILGKLSAKNYGGPLSVELFLPQFQNGDPFTVASEIRRKAEAVMRRARVF